MERSRIGTACAVLWLLTCPLAAPAQSEVSAEPVQPPGTTPVTAETPSPWLFVPLVSSNPKLGSSLGLMAGYLRQFDRSEPSLFATQLLRSNTSSKTYGLGGKLFWNDNAEQLIFGLGGGRVTNDYLDFLGSGLPVHSDESLRGYVLRYQHRIRPHWYLGGQAIYANYAIETDDLLSHLILDQAGLAGAVSAGVGLVLSYDTRDNTNNPQSGVLLQLHNFWYREGFGSDDEYNQLTGELKWFKRTAARNVLVLHGKWRWTQDAPAAKQSTVELRGYTRGQYLGRNALTLEAEDRYMFLPRWGGKFFAGVACLHGNGEGCSNDNLYPMLGAGVFYVVKPEANMVVSAEVAKGNGENRGFYLNFGHRF